VGRRDRRVHRHDHRRHGTERFVLRKLVNQPPITLFMATIGLAFFLEGLGPMLFGNEVRPIELGIVDEPIESILTASTSSCPSSTWPPR
jgi:branched-subunit amino acid ABC-type transport system permease component